MKVFKNIKIICFDADDTLWQNETMFRETEQKFYALMSRYASAKHTEAQLLAVEIKNMPVYGYGIKAFTLSMIETALKVSEGKIPPATVAQILNYCRDMLKRPLELLDGVEETLKKLSAKYKIVVATKGDLLDQERKLAASGLVKYLHHVEIMSDKNVKAYQKLIKNLGVKPAQFIMIGNSLKSDILPVMAAGARAIHIPHYDTWVHEQADPRDLENKKIIVAENIKGLLELF